jgi:hypothetical protein
VHVIGSDVRREEIPAAKLGMLPNSIQNGNTPDVVKIVGRLQHRFALYFGALWIGAEDAASKQVVGFVDRTGPCM